MTRNYTCIRCNYKYIKDQSTFDHICPTCRQNKNINLLEFKIITSKIYENKDFKIKEKILEELYNVMTN